MSMDFDIRGEVHEEAWLSDEFSAVNRKEILRYEYEQFMMKHALSEKELPDDPVLCGEYFDLLEAVDEYTIK